MEAKRVALIGYGYWGPNLARNLSELPGVEMVAVADLNNERLARAKKLYPSIITTQNDNDLFSMGLDAVVIATPPTTHHAICRKFLENGLNVMVEKPITLHSADAVDLCNLASEKGLVLMVGHTFEYNPGVLALKRMIETHELGDIYYIDTARLNLGLFQPGLNVMWDLAPHDISILNFITGSRPISVNAMGTHCVFNSIYDVAYLTLHYQGGIIAHVHVSWLDPCKVRRVTVVGSKKMVVYNDIEVSEKIKIFDKGVETPTHDIANFDEFQCSYRSGDVLIPNIKMTEPLRAECQHFIDCVTNGTTPCSSGVDGLNVVKVLEAADLSLHNSGHMEEIEWETEKLPELAQM